MKHNEFQVERHGFGNEARAFLRVDLRGAFFHLKKNVFRQSTSESMSLEELKANMEKVKRNLNRE